MPCQGKESKLMLGICMLLLNFELKFFYYYKPFENVSLINSHVLGTVYTTIGLLTV